MKIVSSKRPVRLAAQLLGALFALGCGATDPGRSDSTNPEPIEHTEAESRVVGYLPTYRSLDPSTVDLDTLTHLNIAFANPTTEEAGSAIDFEPGKQDAVRKLVAAAHKKNVKVLASIGGGTESPRTAKVLLLDSEAFVHSTLKLLAQYDLDGIDIDLEGEAIDPVTYEKLVNGLVAQRPAGKLLTAAVATWVREKYRALDQLDFLTVMSYDQCGDWSSRCPHSTYARAEEELEYWSTDHWQTAGGHFDKANVVLGVPFYGRCWGTGCSQVTQGPANAVAPPYEQILSFWSNAGHREPVPDLLEDESQDYYLSLNGPETIERKAILAKQYGGVMIWELGQDARGPNSLFSAIQKTR
ncbi:MAG TPA: glycosyl hydrolase family 18 protein [Polyangiaceae bacterium]|nr:glycosyl hydrolase family 18 protein [Polyangiaceae bacterium]